MFLDEPSPNASPNPGRDSIYNSKYNSALQQNIRRLESSLLKVVIVLEEEEHGRIIGTRMAEL